MTEAQQLRPAPPEPTAPGELMTYEEFGVQFLRRVLNVDRITACVDRALGDTIKLGPMGAGPGRRIATLTADGRFRRSTGRVVPGPFVRYAVDVPVDVDFHLDLKMDAQHYHAQVVVPLEITVKVREPLTIVWEVKTPSESEFRMELSTETRRSAVLSRIAGMEGELRRFLVRFVEREISKPHIVRATNIELDRIIDGAWEALARQFLPNSPDDRTR